MENHLGQMQALLREGTSFVCVTLVEIKGSTPRAQGGRMLVTASGLHSGTVGGGLLEAKAMELSQEFLNKNEISDSICEECKKEDESVKQNLILTGYKVCNSCRISKTIFPI